MEERFETIARAVIINKEKILLARSSSNESWYFLPGGHVEFGESVEKALMRESLEEFGIEIKDIEFIGALENVFTQDNKKHHEINVVFSVSLRDNNVKSREDHIVFTWKDVKDLESIKILPKALHKALLSWIKDKEKFWVSDVD